MLEITNDNEIINCEV